MSGTGEPCDRGGRNRYGQESRIQRVLCIAQKSHDLTYQVGFALNPTALAPAKEVHDERN